MWLKSWPVFITRQCLCDLLPMARLKNVFLYRHIVFWMRLWHVAPTLCGSTNKRGKDSVEENYKLHLSLKKTEEKKHIYLTGTISHDWFRAIHSNYSDHQINSTSGSVCKLIINRCELVSASIYFLLCGPLFTLGHFLIRDKPETQGFRCRSVLWTPPKSALSVSGCYLEKRSLGEKKKKDSFMVLSKYSLTRSGSLAFSWILASVYSSNGTYDLYDIYSPCYL